MPVRRHDKRPGGPKHSLRGWEVNGSTPAHDTSRDPLLFVHGVHVHKYGQKMVCSPSKRILSPSLSVLPYKHLLEDVQHHYWVVGLRWISACASLHRDIFYSIFKLNPRLLLQTCPYVLQHTDWLEFKLICLSASLVSVSPPSLAPPQPVAGINLIVFLILPLIHIQKHQMWQDVVDFHFIAIFQSLSASRRDGSS